MPHLTNKELEARLTKNVIYQAIKHGINVVSVNGNLAIKENLTEYKYIFDTPKGLLVCTFDSFDNGSQIYNSIGKMLQTGPTYTKARQVPQGTEAPTARSIEAE